MHKVQHEKFIVDENGKKKAVIIEFKDYKKMLYLLEEAECVKIINEGEQEYRRGKLKPIKSLAELDK
ncbi:MAG: hypothetical protein Q6358_04025 [Candidatus Brocadiales bacterium]|nr:hypothetical protein [Candidatus Brocadiales bacterium]